MAGGITYFGRAGADLILQPGGKLKTDKWGLTTGSLKFLLRPGRLDLVPAFNSAHPWANFCLLEDHEVIQTPGWWTVIANYAGGQNDDSEPEYELEIGESREPIETHPRFVSHIAGKPSAPLNGAVFVDDTGHPTSDDALGIFDRFRATVAGARNRLAGVTAYEAANQIHWVKGWTSRSRPTDGGDVGSIENPEGPSPNYGDGRDWRYVGMTYQRRGGAYSIRKMWRLSGPGGWNPTIYG